MDIGGVEEVEDEGEGEKQWWNEEDNVREVQSVGKGKAYFSKGKGKGKGNYWDGKGTWKGAGKGAEKGGGQAKCDSCGQE